MPETKKVLILSLALILLLGIAAHGTFGFFSDTETSSGNTFTAWVSTITNHYLHNNPTPPTGDTNSQAVLPMDTTPPTATTLYNYDQDRDAFAGLLIQKGAIGAGETDLVKYQAWRSGSLPEGLSLVGTVTIDLWTAMKDFGQDKAGEVIVYLRDYNGSSHTEIGNGTVYEIDWQGGSATWVQKTITISGLNYTIPAGNELEVKLIVGDNGDDDIWFAYDTTSYSSVVKIPD